MRKAHSQEWLCYWNPGSVPWRCRAGRASQKSAVGLEDCYLLSYPPPPLPCFLEVLILRDFKSFAPEVLILGDFKSLFPEVLILVDFK
jgi:hypothetical protein